jgi:hypothetical protein
MSKIIVPKNYLLVWMEICPKFEGKNCPLSFFDRNSSNRFLIHQRVAKKWRDPLQENHQPTNLNKEPIE